MSRVGIGRSGIPEPGATDKGAPRLFPWVQVLRAGAAFAVAFAHVANDAIVAGRDPGGMIAAVAGAMPWNAGVDVFFVVSGFVIIHASGPLFARPGGALQFLCRRLTRIVPLYWMVTTLFLGTWLFQHAAVRGHIGGPAYIIAGYLFVPWPRPDGLMQPPLGVGWTLNYEMFFYFALTPFLFLRRLPAVLAAGFVLCALVALGRVVGFGVAQLDFWTNPIILEFVIGMSLALAVVARMSLAGWLRITLAAIALAALYLAGEPTQSARVVSYGMPAALLVGAAVLARAPPRIGWIMRGWIRLGDASYAMYLFHPFVMRGFTEVWGRPVERSQAVGVFFVVLSLLIAQVCALAINIAFERRMAGMLRGRAASGAFRAA